MSEKNIDVLERQLREVTSENELLAAQVQEAAGKASEAMRDASVAREERAATVGVLGEVQLSLEEAVRHNQVLRQFLETNEPSRAAVVQHNQELRHQIQTLELAQAATAPVKVNEDDRQNLYREVDRFLEDVVRHRPSWEAGEIAELRIQGGRNGSDRDGNDSYSFFARHSMEKSV